MTGSVLNPLLGFGAGALTILNPCVLPLVPIVLGSAAQRHRYGALALSAGLVMSFTAVSFLVAAAGPALGVDPDLIRTVGAVLLLGMGLALLLPATSVLLSEFAGPLASWANARQSDLDRHGLAGQAGVGVLLGLIWSPCIGPTLGAATVLAAEGRELGAVAVTIFAFGLGIASVLVAMAMASRELFIRWRSGLLAAGSRGKILLGSLLMMTGIAILTGVDRVIEAALVDLSPDWFVSLTTSI